MKPELIVMLTHNDRTVENAIEIYRECRNSKAKFWGFKEVGLPIGKMKELCAMMKADGKTTFLEISGFSTVMTAAPDNTGIPNRCAAQKLPL